MTWSVPTVTESEHETKGPEVEDIEKFRPYPKTPRLFRDVILTEKIDGSNACIAIEPIENFLLTPEAVLCEVDGCYVRAGSRTRWITPKADNYGFAQWVLDNKDELVKLGAGRHFGEWWGKGIQRNYGVDSKRFSLFNVVRWRDGAVTSGRFEKGVLVGAGEPMPPRPACCGVVPELYHGLFCTSTVKTLVEQLSKVGSKAAPGFMQPEGVVVFHTAAQSVFKVLIENDGEAKGE